MNIMKHRFGLFSIAVTALGLPISLLVGSAVNYTYNRFNNQSLDISSGSAYLHEAIILSLITFVVLLIIGLVFSLIALKKSIEVDQAKLSLLLIMISVATIGGASLLYQRTQSLQQADQTERLKTFFNQLSK